jgi:hypothetical protein
MFRSAFMQETYGIVDVKSFEHDWQRLSSNHRVENRSAYLLDQRWLAKSGSFPAKMRAILESSSGLNDALTPVFAVAEHIAILDTLTAPSRTDLMVYCKKKRGTAVVGIEAKCDEPFDKRVAWWVRDADSRVDYRDFPVRNSRARRLRFLGDLLGFQVHHDSMLRYQLLHRTVAILLEARRIQASTAVVVIYAFSESKENWADYRAFAEQLGFGCPEPDSISSAMYLPAFPEVGLHLAWIYDLPNQERPGSGH